MEDLGTKPEAPPSIRRRIRPGSVSPDRMVTGTPGAEDSTLCRASIPEVPGMLRSSSTRLISSRPSMARSKDIASRLGVSRASVTEALRALAKKDLINYAPYEAITMTEQGKKAAEDVIYRHDSLKRFFTEVLAIDAKMAEEAACRVEHSAPPVVISRMIEFIKFLQACPRGGDDLLKNFGTYCQEGTTKSDCSDCISSCFDDTKSKS